MLSHRGGRTDYACQVTNKGTLMWPRPSIIMQEKSGMVIRVAYRIFFLGRGGTTDSSITYIRYCITTWKVIVEYFCNGPVT